MSKIHVLHILSSLRSGGVAVLLYNYYMQMDHETIAFDYIVHVPDHGMVEQLLEGEDTKVYHLPRFNHLFSTFFETRKIIKEGNYKIVHVHHTSKSFLQLLAAMSCGVNVRIAHSHEYVERHGLNKAVFDLYGRLTTLTATDYFACSNLAGKYVFGNKTESTKYRVINNAIKTKDFVYNPEARLAIRNRYGIEKNFIVLHVGRFAEPKNHIRLIRIFREIKSIRRDAKLILVGTGELEKEIRSAVKEYDIENDVIFVGESHEVNVIMQAADVFLLPSLHEGLGIVLVEAQASGLPCFTSKDVVPKDVNLTGLVKFISLDESNEEWARQVCSTYIDRERKSYDSVIREANYELSDEAIKLQEWYKRKYNYDEN